MKLKKWGTPILSLLGVLILFLHFDLYEGLIFRGEKLPQQTHFTFNFPFEERNFQANDGGLINAVLMKTQKPAKGIIIYNHGNKDNLNRWANESHYLTQLGYDVMVYDYRGYGKSTGQRSESNFYGDAWLVYQQCLKLYPADSIIVYGRSLGTGPASWLAANARIKATVLETPYTNMTDLIEDQLLGFPMRWFLNYTFDNSLHLKNTKSPVFIVHGTEDKLIPVRHAHELAATFSHPKSQLLIIPGGQHNNLRNYRSYQKSLVAFFTSIGF